MPKSPHIAVWYGHDQSFGQLGCPLRWINILGSVSNAEPLVSVRYSLNGGPETPLALGPDARRLLASGDFNVELATGELNAGLNTLIITAESRSGQSTSETVRVHWTAGTVWPLPSRTDWAVATSIGEAAQVTDGLWSLRPDGVSPLAIGYDRLIAIGDLTWQDYEVTVPITVHAFDTACHGTPISVHSAVGLVLRWQGHHDWEDERPRVGYAPAGAIAWYSWIPEFAEYRLTFMGGTRETLHFYGSRSGGKSLRIGMPTLFKARAQTQPDGTTLYSLKIWEEGEPEPVDWDISAPGIAGGLSHGSVLLIAHHADATFGDIALVPIP